MSACLVKRYIQGFCSVCIVRIDTRDFAQFVVMGAILLWSQNIAAHE
jgi:hypothetical protein